MHQPTLNSSLNLRYYDYISEGEHFCTIHLLRIDNTSPIHTGDIVHLKDMPAALLIHVLIDYLREMLTCREQHGNYPDCSEPPSSQVITGNLNNLLLATKGKALSVSSNSLFSREAHDVQRRTLLSDMPLSLAIDPSRSFGSSLLPTTTSLPNDGRMWLSLILWMRSTMIKRMTKCTILVPLLILVFRQYAVSRRKWSAFCVTPKSNVPSPVARRAGYMAIQGLRMYVLSSASNSI